MTGYSQNRGMGTSRGTGGNPQQPGGERRGGREFFRPTDRSLLEKIITDPNSTEKMVEEAERVGEAIAKTLSTSQIRAIFSEVRSIEADWQHNPQRAHHRLLLLKPKMDYRAKKESGGGVGDLVKVLKPAVDFVRGDTENFKRFVEFFEAILAYHRAYGDR